MKKIFILLFFLFFPIFVFAKEDCTVVSGNGRNIGDEIKCGTESFYIVFVDLDNVYMLSKYNLFVGDKIDFIPLPNNIKLVENDNSWYGNVPDVYYDNCYDYALEKGYDPYFVYPMTDSSHYYDLGEVYITGCRVYEELEYEHIRQDERAVGTKLDGNGKSILPLYGITYMDPYYGYDAIHDGYLEENEYDENGDLILHDGSSFKYYLDGYKDELIDQGINVKDVSFLKLSNALNLLENVSGKSVDVNLKGFYSIFGVDVHYKVVYSYMYDNPLFYTTLMDISEYIGENHKWISSSTYWLGSGFHGNTHFNSLLENPFEYNDYYISNEEMLCAIARGGQCGYLNYPIGNGLRPMVTVSKNDIAYNIDVVTNGNGNIEVIDSAVGGEKIEFKVTSKKGYKLTKLVVISSSGEKVQFTEGDVVVSEDGIATIDKNVFTMPYDCVVIQAEWSVINPNTVSYIFTAMFILSIFGGLVYYLKNKRKVQVYQQCNEE